MPSVHGGGRGHAELQPHAGAGPGLDRHSDLDRSPGRPQGRRRCPRRLLHSRSVPFPLSPSSEPKLADFGTEMTTQLFSNFVVKVVGGKVESKGKLKLGWRGSAKSASQAGVPWRVRKSELISSRNGQRTVFNSILSKCATALSATQLSSCWRILTGGRPAHFHHPRPTPNVFRALAKRNRLSKKQFVHVWDQLQRVIK